MPATLPSPASRQTRSTRFSPRGTSRRGSIELRREAWQRFASCRLPGAQRRRVDADRHPRCSSSTSSRLPIERAGRREAAVRALLAARRRARPARTATLDSRRVDAHARATSGPTRACCSAASTSWSHEHGDLIRNRICSRAPSIRSYDKFAALHAACWSGGHAALRAARRGHRRAAALPLGHDRRRRRSGPHAGRPRRRRRSDAAVRDGQPRRRRPAACTAARSS